MSDVRGLRPVTRALTGRAQHGSTLCALPCRYPIGEQTLYCEAITAWSLFGEGQQPSKPTRFFGVRTLAPSLTLESKVYLTLSGFRNVPSLLSVLKLQAQLPSKT